MARIRVDAITPHGEKDYQLWRFVMKGVIGIAASVVVGIAAWHFFVGEPRMAYGVDDLPQRMLALKSLHMKGTIYEGGGPGQPLEMWAERPDRVRVNGHRNETGDATETTDEIISPEGGTTINETKKLVVITRELPVDTEFEAEELLQQMQALLMPQQTGLAKVREEMINSVKADVYESRQTMPGASVRVEIALNPANGLPLRSSMYMAPPSGTEVLMAMFDVIEPNVAIAPEIFVFHPPADYQVSHVDPVPNMSRAGKVACGTKYVISINRKAILLCWARYDTKNPGDDLNFGTADERVDIMSGKNKPYQEHLLRADLAPEGFHWRWSLLTIDEPDDEFGRMLSVQVHSGRAGRRL